MEKAQYLCADYFCKLAIIGYLGDKGFERYFMLSAPLNRLLPWRIQLQDLIKEEA